jgi:hypothetical protein
VEGISKLIHPSTPNGKAILLDEMDGLSLGERGGLQELIEYLKSKRDFKKDAPLFLICNLSEGRSMSILLKYCYVQHVGMPKSYTLESLPSPINPKVQIVEIPEQNLAVASFSWFTNDKRIKKVQEKLLNDLAKDGIKPIGELRYAGYSAPWTPPWMKRSEVMVEIK